MSDSGLIEFDKVRKTYGTGQAKVENVASNRRYLDAAGKVRYDRMSATRNPASNVSGSIRHSVSERVRSSVRMFWEQRIDSQGLRPEDILRYLASPLRSPRCQSPGV